MSGTRCTTVPTSVFNILKRMDTTYSWLFGVLVVMSYMLHIGLTGMGAFCILYLIGESEHFTV